MEKEIAKILEIIISKSSYNKETGKYQLSKEDYTNLNLSRNIRNIINKVCENLGISLEYPNKPLPDIKGEELFQEYNKIKVQLETITNSKDKEQLEQRRIEIRNKITTDNLELINSIINRRLTGIYDRIDKDDIYQTGYEMLLKYIDKNYLSKDTFKNNISYMLMTYIERKMALYNDNTSQYKKEQASIVPNF